MKGRIITTTIVMGILTALTAGEPLAAGRGNGGGYGKRDGSCLNRQTTNGGATITRPADSRRRDGSCLTTGTRANGLPVRPAGDSRSPRGGSPRDTTEQPTPTPPR